MHERCSCIVAVAAVAAAAAAIATIAFAMKCTNAKLTIDSI